MLPITTVDHKVTEWLTLGSLSDISQVLKPPHNCAEGICHSSTFLPNVLVQCTSLQVMSFQAFPYVTASNKGWNGKAWVRGWVYVRFYLTVDIVLQAAKDHS